MTKYLIYKFQNRKSAIHNFWIIFKMSRNFWNNSTKFSKIIMFSWILFRACVLLSNFLWINCYFRRWITTVPTNFLRRKIWYTFDISKWIAYFCEQFKTPTDRGIFLLGFSFKATNCFETIRYENIANAGHIDWALAESEIQCKRCKSEEVTFVKC